MCVPLASVCWLVLHPCTRGLSLLDPAHARREIMRGRSTKEQQQVVAGVLAGLLPPQAPARFRKW